MLENIVVTCENLDCTKYRQKNGLSMCKHGLCLLIERREKSSSIEIVEILENNEFYYEHVLAARTNIHSKKQEFLVKWGPSKTGPRGGIEKWGYGSDLSWIAEDDIRKGKSEYCGIEQYKNVLSSLKFDCLKRKNTW